MFGGEPCCAQRERHMTTQKKGRRSKMLSSAQNGKKKLWSQNIGDPPVFLRLKHKSDGESKDIMNNKK